MDEKGVHSPLNAKKSTVPDVGTASPVQTFWFSVVESVEENVEEVKEGDIVIPVFQRNCGECRDCKYPKGNICSKFPEDFYCGMPSDGSSQG
ncbi:hypothetical protein T459_30950 [Capsicum annuum]|uniref:Alcohol dehydrogenase-like N-terminal domain-containing protein n=1 Tax=Capsicum annuum TaxID=4072 RepID=A0A2G2Y9T4_CAPAN|nr:hypothetical protein T459_30950 [Capsicum annuum]